MYAATGGANMKWGAGTTSPPAGDGPDLSLFSVYFDNIFSLFGV